MNFKGLTDQQVKESTETHGRNIILEAPPETFWEKFKGGFEDPMIRLLCGIAVLMIVISILGYAKPYEAIGIVIAIILVTIISAKTEVASDGEYRKLKNSTKKEICKVHRNGVVTVIDFEDIVVGDMVILQSGDKIPADGILVKGTIHVDNSSLNGESEECMKTAADDYVYEDAEITGDTFVDAHSLFRGETVYNGEGILEVKKVGMNTVMGKMAEDMQDGEVDSPLKVKLGKLAKQISMFGYIGAIVISVVYMLHFIVAAGSIQAYIDTGTISVIKNIIEAVTISILIVVCAVPEGLSLMVALVLMQNTSKMLKLNVLVRKPIGIETAGSLNILFSDKTGTITHGKLEVVEFFNGHGKGIKVEELHQHTAIKGHLDLAICKNTNAMYDSTHNIISGNATDQALLSFLGEDTYMGLCNDGESEITDYQCFNSANKFSSAYISSIGKTFYKGAPEKLLGKATKYLDGNGVEIKLDKKAVDAKINALAQRAMRVLAFGYSQSELVKDTINNDLVIIGFVGIRDDVRPEAKEAIAEVQGAGIQVVMITGDRKETAVAIAKDAGLLANRTDITLTSDELNKMSDIEVKKIMSHIRVIARALPTDKSRMVRLCQEMNLVVGMTGDGVNDSPALKRADVGFAMGSGTAVAKEAGDIVILDDNFKSIRNAILYGRTIYHNILKFCKFQLVINVAAVLVSAIAPFIGVEEPLKVTHLLWVNLVMDALGSLALGNEPALPAYLLEKPRRRDESIISKPMLVQIITMGIYLTAMSIAYFKIPVFESVFKNHDQFMTGYFGLFILSAVANGFNVRSDTCSILGNIKENRGFIKIMSLIVAVQVGITLIGGEWFGCTPFGILGWAMIITMASTMIIVDLLRKIVGEAQATAIIKTSGMTRVAEKYSQS